MMNQHNQKLNCMKKDQAVNSRIIKLLYILRFFQVTKQSIQMFIVNN